MKQFKNRNDLIRSLGLNMVVCEIGVFRGEFSKFIFHEILPKELHLVDIFQGVTLSGDKDGNNIIWTDIGLEYENLKNFFSNDKNVFIHKGRSTEILSKFDDEYFDMIYIDGDHGYEGVMVDLQISYKKVKKGKFICGHDYTYTKFPDVYNAVNDFVKEKNLMIDSISNDGCPSFLIQKI